MRWRSPWYLGGGESEEKPKKKKEKIEENEPPAKINEEESINTKPEDENSVTNISMNSWLKYIEENEKYYCDY